MIMNKLALLGTVLHAEFASAFHLAAPRGPASNVQSYSPSKTSLFSSAGAFSNEDLETAFFSIDVDGSGSIDRGAPFADALADLGVELPESQYNELFDKYDADKGGTIDLAEFKTLMSDPMMSGVEPNRYVFI